jgi:hypothetical protein
MPSEETVSATIPEGESYTASATGSGTMQGTRKIRSGNRMVVDRSAVKNEDIENRVKEVLSDARLNQITKDEEWDAANREVKKGEKEPIALDANESYDHIVQTHDSIKSFLDKLPETILNKAELHDAAAKSIEKIQAGHPEAQKQRDMASKLRTFVGMPDNISNIHQLRDAKEAIMNGGGTLEKNRDYQLKIANKIVQARANLWKLKRGGTTFASDAPSVNHPALKAAHREVMGINRSINSLLKPLGISSPVPASQLTVVAQSIGKLEEPNKTVSPSEFRDEHPDTGELSKPGHIWGEKPGLGLTDKTKKFNPYAAKDYREREQIPLTDEGRDYIKETYGKNHPVMSRFKAAKRSLNKINILKENLRNSGPSTTDDLVSTDDGRNDELKDRLVMGQYSEANQKKSTVNPQAKFVDTSDAGSIARAVRAAAMQGAESMRESDKLIQHHFSIAFESLIAGNKVPVPTTNFIASHPESEDIKAAIERKATAHISAVAAFRSGHRPKMEHRNILGPAGMKRAKDEAAGE